MKPLVKGFVLNGFSYDRERNHNMNNIQMLKDLKGERGERERERKRERERERE